MRALSGVDFDVRAGEVHCLLGPNGAGKSTLIKCVSGAVAPTEGEILVDGEPLPVGEPSAAIAVGVSTIYQELDLVEDLSVSDSIFLGHEHRRGPLLDRDAMRRKTSELLARLGHENISPRAYVRELRPAGQQIVSIARALSQNVRLLIMDEPSSILDDSEVEVAVRRRAAADRRGRRRRLHLAPARRDPAHRLARHRALRRAHRRHRPAGRHALWPARGEDGRAQDRAALPRRGRRPPATSCSRSAGSAARRTCVTPPSRSAPVRCSASAAWSAPGARSCSA